MAQKILTLFEDDLDGSEAEGTVTFALDGSDYEIDLNTEHADALRGVFAPYLAVARKVSYAKPTRRGGGARTIRPVTGPSNTEVREWAKSQGIEVKDRGRLPADLVTQYQNRDKQEGNGQTPDEVTPTPPELTPEFKAAEPNEEKPARNRRKPADK